MEDKKNIEIMNSDELDKILDSLYEEEDSNADIMKANVV